VRRRGDVGQSNRAQIDMLILELNSWPPIEGSKGVLPLHYQTLTMETIMAEKTLEDLFHDTLKDIYYAEKKILGALPKMAKAAESDDLKAAFEKHYAQTEAQVERLEEVFGIIDKKPQGKTCPGIIGILEEGTEVMKEFKGSVALDAALIAAAQAVEHYEITRYGALTTWAETLGLNEAVALLKETLGEEEQTDEDLSALAESSANQKAQMAAE
jgi:ferritin-like metal-binding protein YciE